MISTEDNGISTENNGMSTACQSPPRPPSRRRPSVASGQRPYDGYYSSIILRAGSTLTEPHFGPKDGVHLKPVISSQPDASMTGPREPESGSDSGPASEPQGTTESTLVGTLRYRTVENSFGEVIFRGFMLVCEGETYVISMSRSEVDPIFRTKMGLG